MFQLESGREETAWSTEAFPFAKESRMGCRLYKKEYNVWTDQISISFVDLYWIMTASRYLTMWGAGAFLISVCDICFMCISHIYWLCAYGKGDGIPSRELVFGIWSPLQESGAKLTKKEAYGCTFAPLSIMAVPFHPYPERALARSPIATPTLPGIISPITRIGYPVLSALLRG